MTERPKKFTGKPLLCTYTASQHFGQRVAIIIMVAHQLTAITDSLLPEGTALPCIAFPQAWECICTLSSLTEFKRHL